MMTMISAVAAAGVAVAERGGGLSVRMEAIGSGRWWSIIVWAVAIYVCILRGEAAGSRNVEGKQNGNKIRSKNHTRHQCVCVHFLAPDNTWADPWAGPYKACV